MRTSSRRRTRLELQCNLPYQCSKVVLVDQSNCLFPVNEEEKEEEQEEKEEKEEEEEEEDEIRSTMQS